LNPLRKKIELPENYGKPKRSRRKKIVFGSVLEDSIYNMVRLHNLKYQKDKTDLEDARRVVKRGLDVGNSETALLRLRNFLSKKAGNEMLRYTDDDDLL
jgi:hypothetical protein